MRVIFITCQDSMRERTLSSSPCDQKSPRSWNFSERLARPIRSFLLPSMKISQSLHIYFPDMRWWLASRAICPGMAPWIPQNVSSVDFGKTPAKKRSLFTPI
ncbi:hypothetical protein TNCV_649311 [Trichonephila clavipes]|nr:hypothetical protein TNCV_649311 [Trichonephila clavipes]